MKDVNSDTREIYYQTRQTAASYGVEKKVNAFKASLTYAFENVENYNVQPGAVLSPQDVGHVRVSSLSPALVWDLRDDIFNPRKGALYGLVLKQAMHQLGSGADFTKLSLQSSWYIPVTRGIVGALSARGGKAWPHYETIELPLHERFYLGGSTTVRGYTQDSVGPQVDGTSDGRLRAWCCSTPRSASGPTEGFGLVLFSDAGNVWVDQAITLERSARFLRRRHPVRDARGAAADRLRPEDPPEAGREPGRTSLQHRPHLLIFT